MTVLGAFVGRSAALGIPSLGMAMYEYIGSSVAGESFWAGFTAALYQSPLEAISIAAGTMAGIFGPPVENFKIDPDIMQIFCPPLGNMRISMSKLPFLIPVLA